MNPIANDTSPLTTDRFEDLRGEYGGIYDEELYFANGLTTKFVVDKVFSATGMYAGAARRYENDKTGVQCLHGTVYSVVADCHPESPAFRKW